MDEELRMLLLVTLGTLRMLAESKLVPGSIKKEAEENANKIGDYIATHGGL